MARGRPKSGSMLWLTLAIPLSVMVAFADERAVTILGQANSSSVTCSSGGRDIPRVGRKLWLHCPGGAAVVACDGDSVEPIDIGMESVCRTLAIEMRPAVAEIKLHIEEQTSVEWLRVSVADGEVSVLATRLMRFGPDVRLPIAELDSRLLRFNRRGSSPVTIAPGTYRSAQLNLPAPVTGGELLLVHSRGVLAPVRYEVSGVTATHLSAIVLDETSRSAPALSAPGLAPGTYQVTPRFPDGRKAPALTAIIKDGQSTVVHDLNEVSGAAAVIADPALCEDSSELVVERVRRAGSETRISVRDEVVRLSTGRDCDWVVYGLDAGNYTARMISASSGSNASSDFTVTAGVQARVRLRAPRVMVIGRVTMDGAAGADVTLTFAPTDGGGEVTTKTDTDGSYLATISQEGEYYVFLSAANRAPERHLANVNVGTNALDFDLTSKASIRVVVVGASGGPPPIVELRSALGFWSIRSPEDGGSNLEWSGLELGQYSLSAHQHDLASDVKTIVLGARTPQAIVELELVARMGTVTLRDERGLLVEGASFADVRPAPERLSPGVYSTQGIPRKARLQIAVAGFVPTCRVVTAADNIDVTLSRGWPTTLYLQGRRKDSGEKLLLGFVVGLPGADCPVPIGALNFEPINVEGRDGLLTRSLPGSATLTFINPGMSPRTIEVHGDGTATLSP